MTAGRFPSTQRGILARLGAFLLLPVRPIPRLTDELSVIFYPFLLVVGFFTIFLPRRRDSIDGTVLRSRGVLGPRQVDLARTRWVRLTTNVDDVLDTGAMLRVKGDGREVRVVIFADAMLRRTCLPPWALRAIADGLESNPGLPSGDLVALLRSQAEHLDAGRPHRDSPLRGFARQEKDLTITDGVTLANFQEPTPDPGARRLG